MIILNDGTYYEPDDEYLIQLQQAYSTVDVFAELNAMAMWCDANPKKRKTPRGIKQFITSWLKRAADMEKGVSPFAAKLQENSGKIGLKAWSFARRYHPRLYEIRKLSSILSRKVWAVRDV